MFVDASVIIAILTEEEDGKACSQIIEGHERRPLITSVLASWEATVGLFRKTKRTMDESRAIVGDFVRMVGIEVLPLDAEDEALALRIFETRGRHRLSEDAGNMALNMADCFHYAVAKRRNVPILTKDQGFTRTDLATITIPSR